MPLTPHDATDVTVELFNHCAGTCTGCVLSSLERKAVKPVMSVADFATAMQALAQHGQQTGLDYRVVLVFGDVPALPLDQQLGYYDAVKEAGLQLGLTMTFATEGKDAEYRSSLDEVLSRFPDAVFDITVDPFRLERYPAYAARVLEAANRAPILHLAALLSDKVMQQYSPKALTECFETYLPGRPMQLGFTPATSFLDKRNYGYEVDSAAAYARDFYRLSGTNRDHFGRELERFESRGDYTDFMGQTFHIGAGLELFPVAYSMFGDLILDQRNGGKPIGVLQPGQSLSDLLGAASARRFGVYNAMGMDKGDSEFGCASCEWREACTFNGVGLARHLYRGFENKLGSCYGPADLIDETAGAAA
ncbi:MAG: hypothetical protein Alpg2KO_17530 [Alphaproteobacteria bacterium]